MEIVMGAMSGKVSASHCMSSVALEGSHKRSSDPLFAFPLTSGRSTFPRLLFLIGNCGQQVGQTGLQWDNHGFEDWG